MVDSANTMNGAIMSENARVVDGIRAGDTFTFNKLANGFSAIKDVFEAYNSLKNEVSSREQFEQSACHLLQTICEANTLVKESIPSEYRNDYSLELGSINASLNNEVQRFSMLLKDNCPYYSEGNLAAQVSISAEKPNLLLIRQQKSTNLLETILKRVFFHTIQYHLDAHFTFVDLANGGSAFPFAQEMISSFPMRSGGCICVSEYEFEKLIEKLSEESTKSISLLGDGFESALSYNQVNTKKIAKHFVAIFFGEGTLRNGDALKKLAMIARNREKNNMDFVLIGKDEVLSIFSNISDLYVKEKDGKYHISRSVEYRPLQHSPIDGIDVDSLIETMRSTGKVDTRFESNSSIFPEYLSMDSSEALRIPFALGENGDLQYFEIGGSAATHALISGKTGSGKSVALHTLIMQIISNYHPDDVEIWAIDYKAVEFDWYIKNKAPHFRVIARDSSDEFSYSLLDLIYSEYEKRQQLFLQEGVADIRQYRKKLGSRSMPRIVVFIDEFQIMTQSVQGYTGNKDYRKVLENLLRLTRAMGISFVFCSQTVASGLGGLTDAARDQIACRLCLQQQSVGEIRETLAITGPDEAGVVQQVENLRKGQAVYKRARWQNEHAPDGKAFETKLANIIYMSEEEKSSVIREVIERIGDDYTPKEEVIVRGEARVGLFSKTRHPVVRYLKGESIPEDDCIEWYPAAPASLEDCYRVDIEDSAGSNILLIGENDELRDSVVVHSVTSWLADSRNRIIAVFVNENYPDRRRMISNIQMIKSNRMSLNIGTDAAISVVNALKIIKPDYEMRTIYLWYGLDRFENELFLKEQNEENTESEIEYKQGNSSMSALDDLTSFLAELDGSSKGEDNFCKEDDVCSLDYSDCKKILRQAFERGPENNHYHFVIFNNRKGMKKTGIIDLSDFDNRIGTKMNNEDSFELFGTSQAISKANDSTVVYSSGNGRCVPLRPYLMPTEEEYEKINNLLEVLEM